MKNINATVSRRALSAPSPSKSLSTKPYHSTKQQRRLVQKKKSAYFNRELQQQQQPPNRRSAELSIVTSPATTTNRGDLNVNNHKDRRNMMKRQYLEESDSDMDEVQTPADLMHINQLRDEAYRDLELDYTTYNYELVYRMRSEENSYFKCYDHSSSGNSSSSSNSSVSSFSIVNNNNNNNNNQKPAEDFTDDKSIDELIDIFDATSSIKDYSQLLQWEASQNPSTYFENEEDYGNLF